jgi:mevalonate kinase
MRFSSKILLFGEYSVLYGSDALLMPFPEYSGYFDFYSDFDNPSPEELTSNQSLLRFKDYIQRSEVKGNIDIDGFSRDLSHGLYFRSNIPHGYGVGSSGALVAAFYHRYFQHVEDALSVTKQNLATLESFFHGSSSGLDPLVSYMNKPILLTNGRVRAFDFENFGIKPFLIDTKINRSTARLVSVFKQKSSTPEFMGLINNDLVRLSNQALARFLSAQKYEFFAVLKKLSQFQLTHLSEMILPDLLSIWKDGIETDEYFLKLCGAGGGGFLLGFAKDEGAIDYLKKNHRLRILSV